MTDSKERLSLPAGRQVVPSILSADYARLGEQVGEVLEAGARMLHVDVMDGHFVPPITIGPVVVESIADQVHSAGGFLDVHLMVERPERQVEAFSKAGADGITIHYEATPNVHYTLVKIREQGCLAGVAINPSTTVEHLADVLGLTDLVLCMTVNPGWGGQAFIEASPHKLSHLSDLVAGSAPIEVDGGIDATTAPLCASAGASLFVAGSAIFKAGEAASAYRAIAEAVQSGDR